MCTNGLPQDGGGGDKQPQKNLTILPTFPLFGYPVCVKFHSWGPKIRFHVVFHDGSKIKFQTLKQWVNVKISTQGGVI